MCNGSFQFNCNTKSRRSKHKPFPSQLSTPTISYFCVPLVQWMLKLGQFARIIKLMGWRNETWHEQFGSWNSNLASTTDNLKVGICSCILDVWSWWTRTGENRGPSAGPTIIRLPCCQKAQISRSKLLLTDRVVVVSICVSELKMNECEFHWWSFVANLTGLQASCFLPSANMKEQMQRWEGGSKPSNLAD